MRFKELFEVAEHDALAHEILSSHLTHDPKNSGQTYSIYRGVKHVDDDTLHHDLSTSGWRHEDSEDKGDGYIADTYVRKNVKGMGRFDDGYISVDTKPSDDGRVVYSVMHRHDGVFGD